MSAHKEAKQAATPSDGLQHIQFEGCDVCVIAPEDYDALVTENKRLEAMCADLCYAVTRDPLMGQRLGIDLATTVRTEAHQAMQELLAQASADATQAEEQRAALVAALERYGRHGSDDSDEICARSVHSANACTCGFDAALSAARGES